MATTQGEASQSMHYSQLHCKSDSEVCVHAASQYLVFSWCLMGGQAD